MSKQGQGQGQRQRQPEYEHITITGGDPYDDPALIEGKLAQQGALESAAEAAERIKQERELTRQAEFEQDADVSARRAAAAASGDVSRLLSRSDRLNNLRGDLYDSPDLKYIPHTPGYNNYYTSRMRDRSTVTPLNKDELAMVNLYRGPDLKPVGSPYLLQPLKKKQHTSLLGKYKKRLEERQARVGRFREAYPDATDQQLKGLILQAQAYNSRAKLLDQLENPKPQRPKKQYTDEELLLRRWHSTKPSTLTNINYTPVLHKYRGDPYVPEHLDWRGTTPQTMKTAEYDKMVKDFSEMVGVANFRPEFDPRLLTEASARQLYGDEGYVYETLDMDTDYNTPGVLKITRLGYVDEDTGRSVPDRVIAIGGYKIPNASQEQTRRLVEDIAYYDQYPKAKDRREVHKSDFLKRVNPFKKVYEEKLEKVKHNGFKLISVRIADYLKANGISAPTTGDSAYICLVNRSSGELKFGEGDKIILAYQINPVTWNTIISRLAKLFAYYWVFPSIKPDIEAEVTSAENPGHKEWAAFAEYIANPYDAATKTWTNMFIYPPLEAVILRDRAIQESIKRIMNERSVVENVLDTMLGSLMRIVCKYMMNINLPLISLSIYNAVRTKSAGESLQKYIHSLIGNRDFVFVPDTHKLTVEQFIQAYNAMHVMTPIKSAIIKDNYIKYLGEDSKYIHPDYYQSLLEQE